MKRHTWEDALVDAQAAGLIDNGALLVALKLAKAINWSPTNGRPAGLYWKNDDALKAVGAGRASFYRHRPSLVETGFLVEVGGNLLPKMPESQSETTKESLGETTESLGETEQSQVETGKSLGDNPLSVDIFSEDVLSGDSFSEDGPVVADAPTVLPNLEVREGSFGSPNLETWESPSNGVEEVPPVSPRDSRKPWREQRKELAAQIEGDW